MSSQSAIHNPKLELPTLRIAPSKGWVPLKLKDLWEYRELLYFLVWRDIKVRYKQTALGATWAIIQPFFTMVVFSIFFGHLAKVPSDGIPYPIFSYCALVPWLLFAFALTESATSLAQNQYLITKIYFPRLIIPLAPIFTGLVDFLFAFILLVGMMLFYGIVPKITILLFPVFLLLAMVASFGVGVWLAALTVEYRDLRYTIPFLVQFCMFASPIAYPSSLVPGRWKILYALNPMTSVIEGFRWVLLGTAAPPLIPMLVSGAVVAMLAVGGIMNFHRLES